MARRIILADIEVGHLPIEYRETSNTWVHLDRVLPYAVLVRKDGKPITFSDVVSAQSVFMEAEQYMYLNTYHEQNGKLAETKYTVDESPTKVPLKQVHMAFQRHQNTMNTIFTKPVNSWQSIQNTANRILEDDLCLMGIGHRIDFDKGIDS